MADAALKILIGLIVLLAFAAIVAIVSLIPLSIISLIAGFYVAYLLGSIVWEWLNVR